MDPPVILALVGVVGRVVPHDHPVVLLTGEGFRGPAGGRLRAIVEPDRTLEVTGPFHGVRDCAFRDPAGNLVRINERR